MPLHATVKISGEIEQEIPNVQAVQVQTGEGDRTNSCSLRFYDPGGSIGARLRAHSLKYGGLAVPRNVLQGATSTDGDGAGATTSPPSLDNVPEGTKGLKLAAIIARYCKANYPDMSNDEIAAVLGTMTIESNNGEYLEEIPYNDGGSGYDYLYAFGSDPKWHGRGLSQVTHLSNYIKVGELLGHDFVENPDDLKLLKYAIPALVETMRVGLFTGQRLKDYVY